MQPTPVTRSGLQNIYLSCHYRAVYLSLPFVSE